MGTFSHSKDFQGSHWSVPFISELQSSVHSLFQLPFPPKSGIDKYAGGSEVSTLDENLLTICPDPNPKCG